MEQRHADVDASFADSERVDSLGQGKRGTLVLSDVHLSRTIANQAPFLAYRQPRFLPDVDLARLIVSTANNAARYDSTEIIFNGDIFDFDASDSESAIANDAASSIQRLARILSDHPAFTNAVRYASERGCQIVFVAGNHDAQLGFPEIQQFLRVQFAPNTQVRSWFHQTQDGIHVEHGHLYDPFCTLSPPAQNAKLEDTIGSVASRHVPNIFPNLNPHAEDPFALLTTREEPAQGIRKLLKFFQRPTPLSTSPFGNVASAHLLREMFLVAANPIEKSELISQAVKETGASLNDVTQHTALLADKGTFADFITNRGWKEYESYVQQRLRQTSHAISQIYGARAVIMGHTHESFGLRESDVFFGNSGCWVPNFKGNNPTKEAKGSFVWLISRPGQPVQGNTYFWQGPTVRRD